MACCPCFKGFFVSSKSSSGLDDGQEDFSEIAKQVRERVARPWEGSQSRPLDISLLRLNYKPDRPVDKHYKIGEQLGQGAFGSVFKVKQNSTKQIRAMKTLSKTTEVNADMAFVVTELVAMMRLDHPNVARCYEYFEDRRSIYIICELCTLGDFSTLQRRGAADLKQLRALFRDVLMGVGYCHDTGMAHRDLKFENCLLAPAEDRQIGKIAKVIDFGLASIKRPHDKENWMNEALGTKYFVAPEVINKSTYGPKCDIWSIGVMLYILLTKEHPFAVDATKLPTRSLFNKISTSKLRMKPMDAAHVEPIVVKLLKDFLQKDPSERLDAVTALDNHWLKSDGVSVQPTRQSTEQILGRVSGYQGMSRFEKTLLMLTAHQIDMKAIQKLQETFLQMDINGDGSLSREELEGGLQKMAQRYSLTISSEELEKSFNAVDANIDGKIGYSEWLASTISSKQLTVNSAIKELFNFFDCNLDGKVSISELMEVVGEEEGKKAMGEYDTSHDGTIDLQEFETLMKKIAENRKRSEQSS